MSARVTLRPRRSRTCRRRRPSGHARSRSVQARSRSCRKSHRQVHRQVHGQAGRRRPGFTLLEVLLALALTALVGLTAARLLVGSRSSEAAVSEGSDRVRALDLAADLLAGELRRAGRVPYPAPATGGLDASRPALEVRLGSGRHGDALGVRYLDDRLQGAPVARDLRFDVAPDGRGVPQLYRATASGNRQPLVQGIDTMRVVGWVDATGAHPRSAFAGGPLRPWLLLVELGAEGRASRTVATPLPSRPTAEVVMVP